MLKKEDSLKKRYLAKLSANLVGLAINLVTQAIIPRGLGPQAYGDFHFLSNFFTQIVSFLNMGTSTAFYTKLSQRQQDFGLVSFYLPFAGLVSLFLIIFVGCIHMTGIYTTFLPDQAILYIYLATVFAILAWLVNVLNTMADAYGVTVSTEIARIIQRGLGLALILVLFFSNRLNLTNFFFYHYFILIFLVLAFIWVMERSGHSLRRSWRLTLDQIRAYTKEFYNYSHPLFVYALVGLIVGILDRWMLQKFSGSVEQGFYGLSCQIGVLCFLFTSAMTPLITREFSIAYGKHDLVEMNRLFHRYIPTLYAISVYFACFIAVYADKVTTIIGGKEFQSAALAVTIMAFYPIHQTFGQLTGSIVWATGKTKIKRNIDGSFLILGLPLAFILLAPKKYYGLDLGAIGLAITVVSLQFISVNVRFFIICKIIKIDFLENIFYQLLVIIGFILQSAISRLITDFYFKQSTFSSLCFSFLVYNLIVFAVVVVFPIAIGLNRNDLREIKNIIKRTIER